MNKVKTARPRGQAVFGSGSYTEHFCAFAALLPIKPLADVVADYACCDRQKKVINVNEQ